MHYVSEQIELSSNYLLPLHCRSREHGTPLIVLDKGITENSALVNIRSRRIFELDPMFGKIGQLGTATGNGFRQMIPSVARGTKKVYVCFRFYIHLKTLPHLQQQLKKS